MFNLFKKLVIIVLIFAFVTSGGCTSVGKEEPKNNGKTAVAENEKIVLPEEKPELVGRVKDIVGNEVTVYKVQADTQTEPGGGSRNLPDQSANQNNRGAMMRATAMRVTDETETFIIPVGTPIVTIQRGTDEVKAINLTEIKKDQILRIWKKDGSVVFVQVMGGIGERAGNRGSGNPAEGARSGEGFGGAGPGMGVREGPGGIRQP